MPEILTLLCDNCRSTAGARVYNDRGTDTGVILCSGCDEEIALANAGLPYFRQVDEWSTSWEGPVYGQQYTDWREIQGKCTRVAATLISFLGHELVPAQALQLIEDHAIAATYLERHRDMSIGDFSVRVTANYNASWTNEGVPFSVVDEAITCWLKPALGL